MTVSVKSTSLVEMAKLGPGTDTVMLLERFEPIAEKLVLAPGAPWIAVRLVNEDGFTEILGSVAEVRSAGSRG